MRGSREINFPQTTEIGPGGIDPQTQTDMIGVILAV